MVCNYLVDSLCSWELVVRVDDNIWKSLGEPVVNVVLAGAAIKPFQLVHVDEEMFDRTVQYRKCWIQHGDIVSDNASRLVLVEEQSLPGVGPDGDVGEESPRL